MSLKTFCCFVQKPADAGQDHVECTACILSQQHDITDMIKQVLTYPPSVGEISFRERRNASRPGSSSAFVQRLRNVMADTAPFRVVADCVCW